MDFQKLISRYRQFGGVELVWQYAKLGAVPTVLKGLWRFTVKGSWFKVGVFQCFKGLYGEIIRKVEPFLIQKIWLNGSLQAKRVSSSARA